ncbi:MAG TPA: EamA family transporter [Acidimicrobiales bacterium]|nr:EamA family transporter [Acidimicrobiales bacterium]
MLTATLLALAAAGLHAGWNFLIKTGEERGVAAWAQFTFGAVLGLPVLLVVGLPGWEALPYLAASGLVHVVYVVALVRSYGHGDFGVAYPLARGSGALLAAVGGVVLLGDHLTAWSWVAIGVVLVGITLLVGRSVTGPTIAWALATGVTIGIYTLIDADGARRTDGLPYGLTVIWATALCLAAYNAARGRVSLIRAAVRRSWRRFLVAGACTTAAYTLVLIAVRSAPVGYVATLRESSVVLAALLGWLVLKEPLGERRTAAAAVMTAGLILLVVSRT